ncbi:MAG: SDR family oxidoreductase [Bacteroidales bacterium]|nr:SDR family oxidoreductase [Bacteroidales bacterium]
MTEKSKIFNKKILVTGGAGFIGSGICETLVNQNNEVVCLDNFITGKKENIAQLLDYNNFKLIEGDIRNIVDCQLAVKNVEIVLHQAALGSIPRSIKDPVTTNAINIDGFLNILCAAKDSGVERIVYASSSSVYGDADGLPKVEDRIGNPVSPYGLTKTANELYAKVFSNTYGMKLIGLRYFNVYGKRQDPFSTYAAVIPKFISALLKHESPIINGDGSFSRDFTYLDDVIQINQLAAMSDNPEALNQVYNVAAGERNTINTLYELLIQNLSTFDNQIKNINPIYSAVRQGDIPHSQASIFKAQKFLNYQPQFNLREGIKKTVEWYVKHM